NDSWLLLACREDQRKILLGSNRGCSQRGAEIQRISEECCAWNPAQGANRPAAGIENKSQDGHTDRGVLCSGGPEEEKAVQYQINEFHRVSEEVQCCRCRV